MTTSFTIFWLIVPHNGSHLKMYTLKSDFEWKGFWASWRNGRKLRNRMTNCPRRTSLISPRKAQSVLLLPELESDATRGDYISEKEQKECCLIIIRSHRRCTCNADWNNIDRKDLNRTRMLLKQGTKNDASDNFQDPYNACKSGHISGKVYSHHASSRMWKLCSRHKSILSRLG